MSKSKVLKIWSDLPLWPHQEKAVKVARNYITELASGSCLIRMPTGTGKTGVIAVLSRCFEDTPNVLVVVPWLDLRDQIERDIKKRFWDIIKVDPTQWESNIQVIKPSTIKNVLDNMSQSSNVFITTMQSLQSIYSDYKGEYDRLAAEISIVIVDEGHREPAHEWSRAVRSLSKPTILFTATPYRNDHKVFSINNDYTFVLTHFDAVSSNYIRNVEFIEEEFNNDADKFIDKLLLFIENKFQTSKPPSILHPKVIIRCDTSSDVNEIATNLKARGKQVIAVHDTFTDDDYRYKRIPDPSKNDDVTFWIHQNKLMEGIDDPSFCILAIYQRIGNARSLVQQIGRILRNKSRRAQTGFVFSDPNFQQKAFWEGYLKYEKEYEINPAKYENRQLFDYTVNLQPSSQYFEGNYRERFNIDSTDAYKHLKYPLSANVYKLENTFDLSKLEQAIAEEWSKADLDIRPDKVYSPDSESRIITYISYKNSQYLLDQSLIQFTIGFTVFKRYGNILFYNDTNGNIPEYLLLNAKRLSPKTLEKLFNGNIAKISQLSLMNSDLGKHSIRRRTIGAYSIADTAPGLVDHAHFCSTAQGYSKCKVNGITRRYIGFTRARISDLSSGPKDYDGYVKWLEALNSTINSRAIKTISLFERFAQYCSPPAVSKCIPQNILFDIDDIQGAFKLANTNGNDTEMLSFEDLCYDIENNEFNFIANNKKFKINITYDPQRSAYKMTSPELEKAYIRVNTTNERTKSNLVSHLNRTQSFRIIPKSPNMIYAHSHFYEPRLALWGSVPTDRFDLIKIFYPISKLASIDNEKGKKCPKSGNGWQKGSIFHLIDNLGKSTDLEQHLKNTDVLICDDMQTEIADFIALNRRELKIRYIHAKAFSEDGKKRSATAFQEVCSQAIKNLGAIQPYSFTEPSNLSLWDGEWNSKIGKVKKRIRKGSGQAISLWNEIKEVNRNPLSTKEVWIILGQGFSLSAFEQERAKNDPTPETIQIIYLLHSTWGAVSSAGAILKVFCSP